MHVADIFVISFVIAYGRWAHAGVLVNPSHYLPQRCHLCLPVVTEDLPKNEIIHGFVLLAFSRFPIRKPKSHTRYSSNNNTEYSGVLLVYIIP